MLLIASATLLGSAGAFVAPDVSPVNRAASIVVEATAPHAVGYGPSSAGNHGAPIDPLVHDPFGSHHSWAGAHSRVDASLLPSLAGRALLEQLPLLNTAELAELVTTHPETVQQLLLDPPAASQTESWWSQLPLEVRHAVKSAAPEVVGNLPGIPYSERDVANRQLLSHTIAELEDVLDSGIGRSAAAEVGARLSMLNEVEKALGSWNSSPRRSLINLDTEWPGRAAVVVGELGTADYVSYLIPGMFFTIEGQVGDWTDTAAQLHADQTSWLRLLSKTNPDAADKTVATVAWMGYETPNLFTVGSQELADEGALYLDSAMDSLHNERKADKPYVSLLAHSYGSTAAMKALATGNFDVDSFAVVGSPGSSAQSVGELHVKDGNVYVGEASWDPVVGTAFFGSNPGAASYGAHRMSVNGGTDVITNDLLTPSFGHNEYFAVGSESLRNMALIGIDQGALVTDGSNSDNEKTLALAR